MRLLTPHYYYALSSSCIPMEKKPRDILKEYALSLPSMKLAAAELAAWGFPHPMPSNLASLEPDVLEELFCAADRALTDQHGVGTMKSFTIFEILVDHQLVLDWDLPAQDPVPTWLPVSPPARYSRPDLSFIWEELKEGLKSEFAMRL
jgi:hypothetical protein